MFKIWLSQLETTSEELRALKALSGESAQSGNRRQLFSATIESLQAGE